MRASTSVAYERGAGSGPPPASAPGGSSRSRARTCSGFPAVWARSRAAAGIDTGSSRRAVASVRIDGVSRPPTSTRPPVASARRTRPCGSRSTPSGRVAMQSSTLSARSRRAPKVSASSDERSAQWASSMPTTSGVPSCRPSTRRSRLAPASSGLAPTSGRVSDTWSPPSGDARSSCSMRPKSSSVSPWSPAAATAMTSGTVSRLRMSSVLPMPASPMMSSTVGSPADARSRAARRVASSRSRPTRPVPCPSTPSIIAPRERIAPSRARTTRSAVVRYERVAGSVRQAPGRDGRPTRCATGGPAWRRPGRGGAPPSWR